MVSFRQSGYVFTCAGWTLLTGNLDPLIDPQVAVVPLLRVLFARRSTALAQTNVDPLALVIEAGAPIYACEVGTEEFFPSSLLDCS